MNTAINDAVTKQEPAPAQPMSWWRWLRTAIEAFANAAGFWAEMGLRAAALASI